MRTFPLIVVSAISVAAVSDRVYQAFKLDSLFPRAAPREPRTWSTSRRHGYQGTRKSPDRSDSPEKPSSPKESVEMRAKIRGPAYLRIANGFNHLKTKEYNVQPGEKLKKSWKDPEKLIAEARTGQKGRIILESGGSKIYTAIEGDQQTSRLEAAGPGAQIKRGKHSEWEYAFERPLRVAPPLVKPGELRHQEKIYVKTSSQGGRVGAIGMVQDNSKHIYMQTIKAIASNSPSHSPPPSPGRPFIQL